MYIVARTPGTGQCDDVQCELWLFGNYFRHSISVCSMVVVCQLKDHRLGSIGPFIVHRWTPRAAGRTNAADELASTAEPYMTVYIITVHTIPPLFHFLLFTRSLLFTVITKVCPHTVLIYYVRKSHFGWCTVYVHVHRRR